MGRKTILVVEDNALNMKFVRKLLKIGKYHALEAEDAETGIEMARKHRPDLILMDVQLPGMDGLAATRLIKADPDLKQIAVIALTSFAMSGDKEMALAAGCTGYITKPIKFKKFLKTLDEIFKSMANSRQEGLMCTGQRTQPYELNDICLS